MMHHRYEPGEDYQPGEESIFEHLRDHPPASLRGVGREEGWREGLEAAQEHILTALGDSFTACPYSEPVAGLMPQAVWELAIINAASRLGLQIFADEEEEGDQDED
ncbi:MAG: hypothetical protein HYX95_02360 [Chloroflexi bacterium]|nr:hypothetical protein [Chloroflexota bacterium]